MRNQSRDLPGPLSAAEKRRIARAVAHATGGQFDEDDVQQHIELRLLEQAQELQGRTRAYVRNRLTWETRRMARDLRTYRRYFPQDPPVAGDDDETALTLTEVAPDTEAVLPEDALIARQEWEERRRLANSLIRRLMPLLTKRQRQCFLLFYQGYRQTDIAAALKTSKANVSLHMRSILNRARDLNRC